MQHFSQLESSPLVVDSWVAMSIRQFTCTAPLSPRQWHPFRTTSPSSERQISHRITADVLSTQSRDDHVQGGWLRVRDGEVKKQSCLQRQCNLGWPQHRLSAGCVQAKLLHHLWFCSFLTICPQFGRSRNYAFSDTTADNRGGFGCGWGPGSIKHPCCGCHGRHRPHWSVPAPSS